MPIEVITSSSKKGPGHIRFTWFTVRLFLHDLTTVVGVRHFHLSYN